MKSDRQKNIESYKTNLSNFKSHILQEMQRTWKQVDELMSWIDSEKEKIFIQLEEIDEIDWRISNIQNDLKLDVPSIKDDKVLNRIQKNQDSIEKRYNAFFNPKQMLWNKFKPHLYSYSSIISKPKEKDILGLSSFNKVQNRFIEFNENAEYISDIQVELENEIKNINRYKGEFENFIQMYNNLISEVDRALNNSRVKEIKDLHISIQNVKPAPKLSLSPVDLEKLKKQIEEREKLSSRLIKGDSEELKALQKIKPKPAKEKGFQKEKIISMNDLYIPLNRKQLPMFDIKTGKRTNYISI